MGLGGASASGKGANVGRAGKVSGRGVGADPHAGWVDDRKKGRFGNVGSVGIGGKLMLGLQGVGYGSMNGKCGWDGGENEPCDVGGVAGGARGCDGGGGVTNVGWVTG